MNISAAERRTEGITDGAVDGVTAALQTEADADAADADCDGMAVFTNTFLQLVRSRTWKDGAGTPPLI